MVHRSGRLPIDSHTARPWLIHDVAPDFAVLDVWALPTPGGPDDFARLLSLMRTFDVERSSPVVHALFSVRWALGRLFRLDAERTKYSLRENDLRERLPAALKNPAIEAERGAFSTLFVAADEAAFEITNRTVHGVLHVGWVPDGDGAYRGQMAVLVKPDGALGAAYLAAIAPLRHLVVYPAMLAAMARRWAESPGERITVEQIQTPLYVRELSTLPRIDYTDAFVVDTHASAPWTAEQWARSILEDAPAGMRTKLRAGWTALGLDIGGDAGKSDAVLGWPIRHLAPEMVLLGARSRVGMPGQLLVMTRPGGILFATFVHHRTVATRAVWAAVEGAHVRTVAALLGVAARRAAADGQGVGATGPGAGSAGAGSAGGGGAGAGSEGVSGTFGPGA